jgi:hypothetical protein
MAGAGAGTGQREPLLWVTGALIGVALAIGLVVFMNFGTTGDAGASASASALPGQSVAPSSVAGASALPTDGASAVPPTAAPTAEPTPKPTKTPKPTPTPNTNPAIVVWEVPKLEDCTGTSGGSIHVSWRVERADGVSISIDGPGIYDSYAGLSGEIDLPYGCSNSVLEHTYTLRTIGGTGPVAKRSKTVETRAPSVVSFSMGTPDCGPGDTFVGISMSYEVRAATGAELRRDGSLYSTYSSKANDDIVLYDCSEASQVWKLTTTGGYGDSASKSVTVER